MASAPLELTREDILSFRRRVGSLDERLPRDSASLRAAAWAGLQDSMPRAAVLSLHARVDGIDPSVLDDHSLIQVWGPRYSAFVVAGEDRAVFTLGRMPDESAKRARAVELAGRLEDLLGDDSMEYSTAGRRLGVSPNMLRYAAPTGRVLIRWEGAGKPTIRMAPAPDVDPEDARRELARRHLRVFGPSTAESFRRWAGIGKRTATRVFASLEKELTPVRTPIGDGWILAEDAQAFGDGVAETAAEIRLLPSGDPYYLLQDRDRDLLVPEAERRGLLWTSRVWPGALLVGGEIIGTWRRSGTSVTIEPWEQLDRSTMEGVEAEAAVLPLPDPGGAITVDWVG